MLNDGGVAGGHVVQARQTADALRATGLDVKVATEIGSDGPYDIIHAFGARPSALREARKSAIAVVVSPIWWSADYLTGRTHRQPIVARADRFIRLGSSFARRGVGETARRLRAPLEGAARAFESADLLLPNSSLEAEQIRHDLEVSTPMHVVPNGVDVELFSPPPQPARRSGVLYVGRIEPHKNQLGLIRELRGSGIPVTIVGPSHPDHLHYEAQCRKEAVRANTSFLPPCDQRELRALFRSAAVHAMPSWFETTGLASLEAAAAGCAVVSTRRGYVREYFGDHVEYCDPSDPGSIRRAVEAAWKAGPRPNLREHVVDNFTWSHAARATISGYELALRLRSSARLNPTTHHA